jgi:phosphate transport system permease protein
VKANKSRIEKHHIEDFIGRSYMSFCVLLLITIIVSMVYFVASKGLSTFISGSTSVSEFFLGTKWSPEGDVPSYGALPFILSGHTARCADR